MSTIPATSAAGQDYLLPLCVQVATLLFYEAAIHSLFFRNARTETDKTITAAELVVTIGLHIARLVHINTAVVICAERSNQ